MWESGKGKPQDLAAIVVKKLSSEKEKATLKLMLSRGAIEFKV